MKTYCLIIKTNGGSISDKLWFTTREEAEQEMKYYKETYKGGNYKFEIVKE